MAALLLENIFLQSLVEVWIWGETGMGFPSQLLKLLKVLGLILILQRK